jgi:hypothetical protein
MERKKKGELTLRNNRLHFRDKVRKTEKRPLLKRELSCERDGEGKEISDNIERRTQRNSVSRSEGRVAKISNAILV